jgi:23S rRNA (adenine2503-C2)-methyltransferase
LKPLLRDLPVDQFPRLLTERGHPAYRGRQLAHWLFARDAFTWEAMANLPRALKDELDAEFDVAGLTKLEALVGSDGTRKFLFSLRDGHTVESVIIPMEAHATFCISSQVGCAMACRFCATARGGLVRDLTQGEIVEQVQRLRGELAAGPFPQHGDRQFNVVFMGMGEPLDNLPAVSGALDAFVAETGLGMSSRRIQISTSGPRHGLPLLGTLRHPVGLTISLGGADDAARRKVMPVSGRAGVDEVLAAAEAHAVRSGRTVTVAWVLIAERTDDVGQAGTLARRLAGRPFKVNLIPLNELDDDPLRAASNARVLAFQDVLRQAGVPATIRVSGGRDIAAACGQLRRRRLQREGNPEPGQASET